MKNQVEQVQVMKPPLSSPQHSQEHVLAASPRQGAMTLPPKVVKPRNTRSAKKKITPAVTSNVTRALRSRGKLPKKSIFEFPKRKRTKNSIQGKGKEKEEQQESSHEKEREFDIIQIESDAGDDEARILEALLQNREAQIHDLETDLERSKDLIHFLQMQNKQMSGKMAIYEARAFKYQREA